MGARGGIGGSSGSGGGCERSDPSANPFNCRLTYAEALTFACSFAGSIPPVSRAESGTCADYSATRISTGIWGITCAYDAQGSLVWAARFDDTSQWCRATFIGSVGLPEPLRGLHPASYPCTLSRICLDGGLDAQ